MTDLSALISRLEQATEGSRELDARIWAELDGRDVRINDNNIVLAKSRIAPRDECVIGWVDPGKRSNNFQIHTSLRDRARYTTSLDAALSLLPDDCLTWTLSDSPGGPSAQIILTDQSEVLGLPLPGHGTPALALVIAALKARDAS